MRNVLNSQSVDISCWNGRGRQLGMAEKCEAGDCVTLKLVCKGSVPNGTHLGQFEQILLLEAGFEDVGFHVYSSSSFGRTFQNRGCHIWQVRAQQGVILVKVTFS